MTIYTLSPSDLTFAWDGWRCFYLKIKHNLSYQNLPAMFGKMGSLTSNFTTARL